MGCNCGGRRNRVQQAALRKAAMRNAARKLAKKLPASRRPVEPMPATQGKPRAKVDRRPSPQRVMAKATTYTIVRGDTLAFIASKFGMTTGDLLRFDGGTGRPNLARLRSRNAHIIEPGEVILVPRKDK